MKKFEEGLKQKAHINKIKQAKTTINSSARQQSKLSSSKIGAQAQLLLQLYDQKSYDSIPVYKLLRTSGLQQYVRGFIMRGYGVNLGKLALLNQEQKKIFYQEIKVLPGHAIKLDSLINKIAKSTYASQKDEEIYEQKSETQSQHDIKLLQQVDKQYEKQLQRVLNQYTPQSDQKKKTQNSKYSDKKPITILPTNQLRYTKNKYNPIQKDKTADFKKKPIESTSKPTVKKNAPYEDTKRSSLAKILKNTTVANLSSKKIMEINLEIDKVKALNRSFDGSLMSSTIANIDIEELVYAFSGLVVSKIIPAPKPQMHFEKEDESLKTDQNIQNIDDQVGQILRQSYLHPLYRQQVDQEIVCDEDAYSEGENQDDRTEPQNQFENDKMMESSFIGAESIQFGLATPLKIFDEPEPVDMDYFKPTADSVSNFIKNIVLAAKMQRQIPIMAAAYLQNFLQKSNLSLTSLNYRRLLVTCLLLSSKIWDDESFETPSFSRTFPQYSTVLLNEMQKQIVKFLDYKLKIDKKQYTKIYFKLRKFTKQNIKSYQNRKLTVKRIRQLQMGIKKDYKSNFMGKRPSY